ncbi:vWA domain-containing protein [Nocardioides ultimimeridianus]
MVAPDRDADEILVGFTHALRAAGLAVGSARSRVFLEAAEMLGPTPDGLRGAGRATLCSGPGDLEIHDAVFDLYFNGDLTLSPGPRLPPTEVEPSPFAASDTPDVHADDAPGSPVTVTASRTEVLRTRDLGELAASEKHRVDELISRLVPRSALRRTARRERHRHGELDADRTLRAMLRRFGEPSAIEHRRATRRPRRIVLVVDISGSMTPYADATLRLAHRMTQALPGPVETFAVGTRATSLTRQLRTRSTDRALSAVASAIPDWSGGTRLGDNLRALLRDRVVRQAVRGSVVVIFSDGWEAGDVTLLGDQVRRLHLLAHRTVWVNPHRGKVGYRPVQRGVLAIRPHVDHFVAGHSVAAFADLLDLVAEV